MTVIYITFNKSAGDVATAPWSYNNLYPGVTSPGVIKADLKDDSDSLTGIGLSSVIGVTGSIGGTTTATSGAGSWPEDVFDNSWYFGAGGEIHRLTNLTDGDSYIIEAAGHSSNASRDTNFTVGSTTLYDNAGTGVPSPPLSFSGTVSGTTLDIDMARVSVFGYVNGYKITLTPAVTAPTITGPDTTTEGSATVATGTALDTVTNFSLTSGSNSVVQSIDSATATTLNYVARSGVSLCTPSTSIAGLPLEPTISAASITPYVVQQKADDGTNPPATRNITLNGDATHEVIQTMTATANTTVGESIFGTGLIVVENDMQAYVPKTANGMNITWAADGTFTTDADQTEVITVSYFSPSTGEWSCLSLTIKNSVIISATGISNRDDWVRSVLGKDGNTNDLWIEYWISQGATSGSFNDMAYNWLGSLGYTQSLVDRWFSWEEAELGR